MQDALCPTSDAFVRQNLVVCLDVYVNDWGFDAEGEQHVVLRHTSEAASDLIQNVAKSELASEVPKPKGCNTGRRVITPLRLGISYVAVRQCTG